MSHIYPAILDYANAKPKSDDRKTHILNTLGEYHGEGLFLKLSWIS